MLLMATVLENAVLEAHQWTNVIPLIKLDTPSPFALGCGCSWAMFQSEREDKLAKRPLQPFQMINC